MYLNRQLHIFGVLLYKESYLESFKNIEKYNFISLMVTPILIELIIQNI